MIVTAKVDNSTEYLLIHTETVSIVSKGRGFIFTMTSWITTQHLRLSKCPKHSWCTRSLWSLDTNNGDVWFKDQGSLYYTHRAVSLTASTSRKNNKEGAVWADARSTRELQHAVRMTWPASTMLWPLCWAVSSPPCCTECSRAHIDMKPHCWVLNDPWPSGLINSSSWIWISVKSPSACFQLTWQEMTWLTQNKLTGEGEGQDRVQLSVVKGLKIVFHIYPSENSLKPSLFVFVSFLPFSFLIFFSYFYLPLCQLLHFPSSVIECVYLCECLIQHRSSCGVIFGVNASSTIWTTDGQK